MDTANDLCWPITKDIDLSVQGGAYHFLDFENFCNEYNLTWPYVHDGMTIDRSGTNHFPTVYDMCSASLKFPAVLGPRSHGMFMQSEFSASQLLITFNQPVQWIYISAIKISGANPTYRTVNSQSGVIEERPLDFQAADVMGTYKTFFANGVRGPRGPIKKLTFIGQGFLVRLAAREPFNL
jgi:hypothetical protein